MLKKVVGVTLMSGILIIGSVITFADGTQRINTHDLFAEFTGMTEAEIIEARLEGKSISDLAVEASVVDGINEEMLKAKYEALDAAVEEGDITETRATLIKENMAERSIFGQENKNRSGISKEDSFVERFDNMLELMGMTQEELINEMATKKTMYTIAKEAGLEAEFEAIIIELKTAEIDKALEEGIITLAKAEYMKERVVEGSGRQDGERGPKSEKSGFERPNDDSRGNGRRRSSGEGLGEERGFRQGMRTGEGRGPGRTNE